MKRHRRLNRCVLFFTLIFFGVCIAPLLGKTTLVVHFGQFSSAQEAGMGESNVNWNDADFSDDIVCTTCFAALELQHYLRLATGNVGDFEIIDDRSPLPAGDLFLLGTTQSNAASKPLLEKMRLTESQLNTLGSQEYLLKSRVCDGHRITLLVGGDRIGVLYSVYGYLHDIGCRWFAPGKENEDIPSVTQFQDTAKTERPSFTTRGFHAWHNRANSEFLLWMARNRMNYWCVEQDNHPFLRKIGLQLECGGHEVADLLTKGKPYQDGKTYFQAHPEWFGLARSNNPDGVRGTGRRMNFCTSNSDATDEFMKNILHELVEGRYRAADLIRFWMIDVGTWCECDSCKALGTATDRNLLLVHRLVQEIKKARRDGRIARDVRVRFLAYLDVLTPPSRPLPEDFDYTMATATFYPIRRCYVHDFADSGCSINADLSKQLYGWATDPNRHYLGHLNVGEYYNVSRFRNLPIGLKQTMSRDIPLYHEKGVRNFEYMHITTQEWGSKALTNYQMAQQCWDVNTNCGELWTNYFERRYASAASEMRQFYDELEKMLSNLRMLKYDFAPRLNRGEDVLFPNEHLTYQPNPTKKNAAPSFLEIVEHSKECRRLIDSVRQRKLPQKTVDRVAEDERCFAYAEQTIDYYSACVEAFLLARAGKLEEAKQFQKEAVRLAEVLKNDLDSVKYSYEPKTPTALEASLAPNAVQELKKVLGN